MAEKKKLENQIVKPPSKRAQKHLPQLEQGDNTKYLKFSLALNDMPDIDTHNAEQVRQRCIDYYSLCAQYDMKPGMAGLGLALGVTRKTLWCWVNKVDSASLPEDVRHIVTKAVAILNVQIEDYMQNGKINPASGIFLMKNNYGYVDEVKQVVEHKQLLTPETSEDELRKKYAESMIIDADFVEKPQND